MRVKPTWLFGLLLLAPGCAPTGEPTARPRTEKIATPQRPQATFTPEPDLLRQLTEKVSIGDTYEIMLPSDYTTTGKPKNAGPIISYVWRGQAEPGVPPALLVVTIFSEQRSVDDARQDMRKFMAAYADGVVETTDATIAKREDSEPGVLAGLKFSRFRWSGSAPDNVPAGGWVYGAIDGASVIVINALCFGPNVERTARLAESMIATFETRKGGTSDLGGTP